MDSSFVAANRFGSFLVGSLRAALVRVRRTPEWLKLIAETAERPSSRVRSRVTAGEQIAVSTMQNSGCARRNIE